MVVAGVNCYGVNDGIFSWGGNTSRADAGNNFTIRDSYFHSFTTNAANGHIGVYQTEGAANGLIRHNTLDMPTNATSAIAIWNGLKSSVNILVEGNLLAGGRFTLYAEDYHGANGDAEEDVANLAVGGFSVKNIGFINNRFSKNRAPHTTSSTNRCVGLGEFGFILIRRA